VHTARAQGTTKTQMPTQKVHMLDYTESFLRSGTYFTLFSFNERNISKKWTI